MFNSEKYLISIKNCKNNPTDKTKNECKKYLMFDEISDLIFNYMFIPYIAVIFVVEKEICSEYVITLVCRSINEHTIIYNYLLL